MFALREEPALDPGELVVQVANRILEYLKQHPHAADSLEGIRDWWVHGESLVATTTIERALDVLVNQGLMQRNQAADGISVYCGGFKSRPSLMVVG